MACQFSFQERKNPTEIVARLGTTSLLKLRREQVPHPEAGVCAYVS